MNEKEFTNIDNNIDVIISSLNKIKKNRNISSTQLSKISGVSKSQIANFETGKTGTTLYTLLKIANSLNFEYDEIIRVISSAEDTLISEIDKAQNYYDQKNIDNLKSQLIELDVIQSKKKYIQVNYIARVVHALIDELNGNFSSASSVVSSYLTESNLFLKFDLKLIRLSIDLFNDFELKQILSKLKANVIEKNNSELFYEIYSLVIIANKNNYEKEQLNEFVDLIPDIKSFGSDYGIIMFKKRIKNMINGEIKKPYKI